MKDFLKKYKYIIVFILLIIFLYITESVLSNKINTFDNYIYNLLVKYVMNDYITNIFKVITYFGSVIELVLITFILMIILKDKLISLYVGINLIVSSILNQVLKFIVERPRPNVYRIVDVTAYSYPSGHSMVSVAFYGFLIYLIYKNINNKYLKYSLITILSILVLLIGISRVYLGVHYISDVIAGFIMGISYLIMFIIIYRRTYEKK